MLSYEFKYAPLRKGVHLKILGMFKPKVKEVKKMTIMIKLRGLIAISQVLFIITVISVVKILVTAGIMIIPIVVVIIIIATTITITATTVTR